MIWTVFLLSTPRQLNVAVFFQGTLTVFRLQPASSVNSKLKLEHLFSNVSDLQSNPAFFGIAQALRDHSLGELPGRPTHDSAAQQMEVKMVYRLSTVLVAVHD